MDDHNPGRIDLSIDNFTSLSMPYNSWIIGAITFAIMAWGISLILNSLGKYGVIGSRFSKEDIPTETQHK
ncbi:hypothetical protein [Granulibacter bethesdensis]|uniref:hypothetical protein n=1 Tax=Granulibacter bethesdensis TaxID=364410 RepID=UPI0003F1F881|nr:hypothetical protein [Granulibacter bethesdensis]AHJ66356.1 hypothetical protein GbCGDNIH4_7180 [Granulibacter bethesdensis CGDNIH4]